MKSQKHTRAVFAAVLASSVWSTAIAQEVGTLNTFVNGNKTDAGEVNANFDALKSAINDNNSQIGTLKTDVAKIPAGPQGPAGPAGPAGLPGDTGPAYFASFDFEQQVGKTALVLDASGNGNDLTQNSIGTQITAAGHVGNGILLDGSSGYATNTSANVNLRESLTVSAWIKPTTVGGLKCIVSMDGAFAFGLDGNQVKLLLTTQGATEQVNGWQGVGTVEIGVWTHVMASYDGVAIRTFVNGAMTGYVPFAKGYLNSPAGKVLRIGARSIQNIEYFWGTIDEVRISPLAVHGGTKTQWTDLALRTGVAPFGGDYQAPQYRKVDDVVCLRGLVTGANGFGAIVGDLPVGSRPPKNVIYPLAPNSNGRAGRIDVTSAGLVQVLVDNQAGFIELDGICFSTSIN